MSSSTNLGIPTPNKSPSPQGGEVGNGAKVFAAAYWRKLAPEIILQNIDIAVNVLSNKELTAEQRKYAVYIAKQLLEIALESSGETQ